MKRIDVFASGGTISATPSSAHVGVRPTLGATDLLKNIATPPGVELVFHRQEPRPSNWLTLGDAQELAEAIDIAVAEGSQGALIIQGTDTLDEVPFAVDLMMRSRVPLAFTGAMRSARDLGADGAANIQHALTYVSAAEQAETVVVLNGEVHPAAYVRKAHTFLTDAFESHPAGPTGLMVEGGFFAYRPPVIRPDVELDTRETAPVLVLTAVLGETYTWLPQLFTGTYSGLVVEGMGNGHTNDSFASVIADIAETYPVVLTSRTGGYPLAKQTYNYAGSEIFFAHHGVVVSDISDALKARILLSLAISNTSSLADARAWYSDVADHLNTSLGA